MKGRLNAHVLFSNEVDEQVLRDFISALRIELVDRPLSEPALRELARKVGEDKLKHHGFKKAEVDSSDEKALLAGVVIAEINADSYREAIRKVPNEHAIGLMPFDTNDGLAEVGWQEHYAYAMNLFQTSPIFETRDADLRGAFVGEQTAGNSKWFKNFQAGLNNIPRLAVSGSDAHCFVGTTGDNNKRGYGDYPPGNGRGSKRTQRSMASSKPFLSRRSAPSLVTSRPRFKKSSPTRPLHRVDRDQQNREQGRCRAVAARL